MGLGNGPASFQLLNLLPENLALFLERFVLGFFDRQGLSEEGVLTLS